MFGPVNAQDLVPTFACSTQDTTIVSKNCSQGVTVSAIPKKCFYSLVIKLSPSLALILFCSLALGCKKPVKRFEGSKTKARSSEEGPHQFLPQKMNYKSATQISAGHRHSCVLEKEGSLYCAGSGWLLGGKTEKRKYDTREKTNEGSIVGKTKVALDEIDTLASAADYACALSKGKVYCWGKLPRYNDVAAASKPALLPTFENIQSIALGLRHICALQKNGRGIRCYGGDYGDDPSPLGVTFHNRKTESWDLKKEATKLVASNNATCALMKDSSVQCWGAGNPKPRDYFVNAKTLAAHSSSSMVCIINQKEEVQCLKVQRKEPKERWSLGTTTHAQDLFVGENRVCVGGKKSCCFSSSLASILGDTKAFPFDKECTSSNLPPSFTKIAFGRTHTLFLDNKQQVYCEGDSTYGQCEGTK